jgi:peptidoglycan/xylan/chitin deacetylase (PgdA/CDA1 family)
VAREVLDGVRPGSIVVLHLVGAPNAPATAEALREILPKLRDRGYQPVTLEDLLGAPPG